MTEMSAIGVSIESPPDIVRIELLGRFRLATGSSPERLPPPRLQSLVALLTLHAGTLQSREHIAELFWPDSPEAHARGSLRKLLFDLRQFLPETESLLGIDSTHIRWRLDGPWTLDVHLFETAAREARDAPDLAHAIGLYRGELLPTCYDEWIGADRERLQQIFLELLRRALDSAEGRHDYSGAIEYANRLVQEEPLLEESHRTLMRLHAIAGNRAAALRAYHFCASTLQRELGVEPGPATQEAFELLVQPDDSNPYRSVISVPLIGRQPEWNALQTAWRAAHRGRATVVTLTGEPGIGKTRLLEELLDWGAHQGIPTVYARCYAAEGKLAFAPIAAMVRSLTRPGSGTIPHVRIDLDLAALDRRWLTEIARLAPEILERFPDLPPPGPLNEQWQRSYLFEALAQVILHRQPLILAIDDVQWADDESLAWLHFLVGRHAGARLLLLCASRPEGMSAAIGASHWPELRAEDRLVELDLALLDREDTVALAASVAESFDAGRAEYIWTETEGNPLFIVEMMRAEATESLPTSIRMVLEARLAELSPAARRLAAIASVVGRAFRPSVLLDVHQSEEAQSLRALDELWNCRIIREHAGDSYDFAHDKLRQAAYESIPVPRRRHLHRRVAESIIRMNESNLDAVSTEVAAHYEQAGMPEEAGPFHVLAGDAAWKLFAKEAATAHYRRALDLLPPEQALQVTLKLGELLQATGDLQEAQTLVTDGMLLAEEHGDRLVAARCAHMVGGILRVTGDFAGAEDRLLHARMALEQLHEDALLSSTLAHLAAIYIDQGKYSDASSLLDTAIRLAEQAGDERAVVTATGYLAVLYVYQLDFDTAETLVKRLLAYPTVAHNPWRRGIALANLGLIVDEKGRHRAALDLMRDAYEGLCVAGDEVMTAMTIFNMSLSYRKLGDPRTAFWCSAVSASLGVRVGYWLAAYASLAHLGHLEAMGGHLADAKRLLRIAIEPMRAAHLSYCLCDALYFLADLFERQGELQSALHTAEEAVKVAQEVKRHDIALVGQILATRLELSLERLDVDAAVDRLIALDLATPPPHRRALLAYSRWQLDPTREEDRQAAAALYAETYPERPNYLYRERYRELTGDDLPLPEIPDLPASIRDFPGAINDLIADAVTAVARHHGTAT